MNFFSSYPASFRFHLTVDTLAFGCILPTTGRIRDFHPLETCAARRTIKINPHGYTMGVSLLYSYFLHCLGIPSSIGTIE